MKRLLLIIATVSLFAATAIFGAAQPTAAQGCSYSSGIVDCYGWEFDYEMSTASVTPTGLTLQNLEFGGDSMMYQAHFAGLPVIYDNNACGPYVDLFSTITNSQPTGVRGGTFTQDGTDWLELGAHYQIGSYVLYTAFYFSDAGEMQMRMFARGLQCNVHHVHYPMFVVDTDVEGNTTVGNDGGAYHGVGDEIYYNDGTSWIPQTTETDNLVSNVGHDFIVRDPDTGKTVSIQYDDGIFAPPSGDTFDVQAAVNNRVYTRQSNGPADLAWPGARPGRAFLSGSTGFNGGEWGYNDGETITDPVIVVRGFLDHEINGALPDDWHTSGISVKFIDDPLAPAPTPTPTPAEPTPTPEEPTPTATPEEPTPTATPTAPIPADELTNGVTATVANAAQGEELTYYFDVPSDATSYTVATTASGDADLYTRLGSAPTRSAYDCRPYFGSGNETCTDDVPPAGRVYVLVIAFGDITNLNVTATYEDGGVAPPTATPVAPTATPTPAGPTPTPTPTPPIGEDTLINGVPVTGLATQQGGLLRYTFNVPADATSYTVQTNASGGDADLYTRMGSAPTLSSYDCRPYTGGSNETCSGDVPPSGQLHVMVRGYSSFSNLTLTASYDGGGQPTATPVGPTATPVGPTATPTPPPGDGGLISGQDLTGLSGGASDTSFYTIEVPAGAARLRVKLTVGSGDADLYLREGQDPTTSAYDCRPFRGGSSNETCTVDNPPAGTYHIMVRGWTAFDGTSLRATVS